LGLGERDWRHQDASRSAEMKQQTRFLAKVINGIDTTLALHQPFTPYSPPLSSDAKHCRCSWHSQFHLDRSYGDGCQML
jgi:hypothetical protein